MSDLVTADTGEAVYRTRDAIKNLRIRVRVEKVSSTAALSQHLQHQVLSQDREDIELETLHPPGVTGGDENQEEVVVGWQEKLFSQYEMELFQNEAACHTPLDRQYHAEVTALSKTRSRRNLRIFTYTDHDRYTSCLQLQPPHAELLNTTKTSPTFLAEKMAGVRQRRQDRRTMDSSISKTKIINWEPSEEFVRSSHVVTNAVQTMHIMADLGPSRSLGRRENECLLFTVKTDGNGTVTVKPDFSRGGEPYRIVNEAEKREVWHLIVEDVSVAMTAEEREQEQNMYRDLHLRHRENLNSLVGQDFEMPPAGILRYLVNGEIVSARGFEYDHLHVHFFLELPNSWSSLPFQSHSGVTHTCRTKTLEKENVAFFGFPFSFEAFYMSDSQGEEAVPQWPVLYFKVLSLDWWQRYRTEGYGYLLLPASPGRHTVTCQTWRPLQTGTLSALRRFFIGGSPELEDHSYVRIPGTFKGSRLSRFGFCTETTGSVTFNLNCIQQAKAFVDATMMKRRRQTVFDQLGGFSQQGAVCSVLEAFQRARRRMQEARESFPGGHDTSGAQLTI